MTTRFLLDLSVLLAAFWLGACDKPFLLVDPCQQLEGGCVLDVAPPVRPRDAGIMTVMDGGGPDLNDGGGPAPDGGGGGPVCGDGVVQAPEECDNGGPDSACSEGCLLVPAEWSCPNSPVYGNGTCDCGCGVVDIDCASALGSACDPDTINWCANLYPDTPVVNPLNNAECVAAEAPTNCCGNGIVEGNEECDAGATGSAACSADCRRSTSCGDGIRNGKEGCDDGNTTSGDGCTGCRPDGWSCILGTFGSGGACDCSCGAPDPDCEENVPSECEFVSCAGGGNVVPAEPWLCDIATCGNGVTDQNESCDDGNLVPGDGCNGSCEQEPVCGGPASAFFFECSLDQPNCADTCFFEVPGWTCKHAFFDEASRGGEAICDCGCGLFDPDCASSVAGECMPNNSYCPAGTTVSEAENWRCTGVNLCAE